MGLDITAYRKLNKVENPILDDDGYPEDWDNEWKPGEAMEWSESIWPGKGKPIESNLVYRFDERYDFRAGSYHGYNRWRDRLEEFKGEIAFQELIDFSDSEGVIGSILSKKLLYDFIEHESEAITFSTTIEEGKWWIDKYRDWKKAFELAACDGAVEFH